MSELAHLVETLFQLRGHDAEATDGAVLRFARGSDRTAVRVSEAREPFATTTAQELAETLPAHGHAVLVCAGEVGHESRSILEAAGIEVWTREKLIHEVGKAYVEAAERGQAPPRAPPNAPVHEDEPSHEAAGAPHPAPPSAPAPVPVAASLPLWSRQATTLATGAAAPAAQAALAAPTPTTPATLWTTLAAVPAIPLAPDIVQAQPTPTLPVPEPEPPHDGACIAQTVDRETALRTGVGRLLRVDRATLELVPLLAFRYTCRLETKGAVPVPKHGLLAVDAVTGNVRELPESGTTFAKAPAAPRLEAQVGGPEAEPLVKRKIMEMHSQKMRVQSTMGRNSMMVEDRMVRPNPQTIHLDAQGTWWLPLWTLEGQNGSMRVSGATGAIEEEKLKRAYAQDAEFL